MSPKLHITLLLVLAVHFAPAQTDSAFVLSKAIASSDIVDFNVDNLGNIYVLSRDNQLKKLSANGDSIGVFNDVRRYGKIASIDVTNPLKLLVYYKEFTTIIVLDTWLNKINIIDLRTQNILQAKAIGLAYDNNIWVYDELEAKLKRIGDDGLVVDQTTDFRQVFDSVPDPSVVIDQGGFVYLYDTMKGVYAFDHYGALKSHIPLTGWLDFSVIDKSLFGRDRKNFYRYQLGSLDAQDMPMPAYCRGAIKIRMTPAFMYVLGQKGLAIYSHRNLVQ